MTSLLILVTGIICLALTAVAGSLCFIWSLEYRRFKQACVCLLLSGVLMYGEVFLVLIILVKAYSVNYLL